MLVEEPWLGERDARFRAFRTEAQVGGKALATTGEVPGVEEVEVRLLEGEEADDAVDRAEAEADADRAGGFLFDQHIDVAVSAARGRAVGLDFAEVLQTFEAGLGGLELHRVEHVAGLERNFAADDLVLGLGVAGDVDAANLETGAFVDAVDDVDAVGSGVADVGAHGGIGVSTRSIVAADHLDVLAHLL